MTASLLALWAAPRTISTAFERMVIERGDHLVLDEPWSRAYYFGPERRSDRFPLSMPESTYAAVAAGVRATSHERSVFVKDMAYQAEPGVSDELLRHARHTFLIRDPLAATASLLREWPDATEEEVGTDAQARLWDRIVSLTGNEPVVVDSDALRADPATVIAAWCEAMHIEYLGDALTWEPGLRPEWPMWHDWYRTAAASTGFEPPASPTVGSGDGVIIPERLVGVVERAEARHREWRPSALA